MRLERIRRLIDQRHAVGQEEDTLDPVAALEQVTERDHGAVLPAPVAMTTRALR